MRARMHVARHHLRPSAQVTACVLLVTLVWIWTRCDSPLDLQFFGLESRDPSVHLILASRLNQSYDWVERLTMPNMKIVPYLANDEKATFHPDWNKGNEAMIYLTYLADFYEELPDIAIFTHGQDNAWHVDAVLEESTAYALNRLDLNEVLRRQYLNLRVSWENACPDWMHTNVDFQSPEYNADLKAEEPFMRTAFEDLFPNNTVPVILGQPCCSQFAVTKEAIRSVPREFYQDSIDWLKNTYLPDSLSGRVWEHLWQYLFLKKAVDCPQERLALCLTYHICFQTERDWDDWKYFDKTRRTFEDARISLLGDGLKVTSDAILDADKKIEDTMVQMKLLKDAAIELGMSKEVRKGLLTLPET